MVVSKYINKIKTMHGQINLYNTTIRDSPVNINKNNSTINMRYKKQH